jgi:hypothetical protein
MKLKLEAFHCAQQDGLLKAPNEQPFYAASIVSEANRQSIFYIFYK